VYDNTLYVEVKDAKGPLLDAGIEKAKKFTREDLQPMRE